MVTLVEAAAIIERFEAGSLTSRLAHIERQIQVGALSGLFSDSAAFGVSSELLQSAWAFKHIAEQINVLIHATGILLSLLFFLEKGEIIQAVSLGAGNIGKPFDLETDRRIAEFKFINWRGGAEAVRQNGLFKDFYRLAESSSCKYYRFREAAVAICDIDQVFPSVPPQDLDETVEDSDREGVESSIRDGNRDAQSIM